MNKKTKKESELNPDNRGFTSVNRRASTCGYLNYDLSEVFFTSFARVPSSPSIKGGLGRVLRVGEGLLPLKGGRGV